MTQVCSEFVDHWLNFDCKPNKHASYLYIFLDLFILGVEYIYILGVYKIFIFLLEFN